jgi:BirA family biotin operon repressor/biotin-[acetyl-CoA-carboxylase] ligase
MKFQILEFDQLDSTSTYLKKHANQSAEGTVVCAKMQTGGRGRLGKAFLSPPGTGLYFSVLLRPKSMEEALLYPFAAGIAVADAIREVSSAEAGLKWPNDVLVHGRKVTGILAEMVEQNAVIIGIGINLTTPYEYFKQNGLAHVTSILSETGVEVSTEHMRHHLLARLSNILKWEKAELLTHYRSQCVTIGRQIHTSSGIDGICTGVSDKGELIIKDGEDREHFLNSGEVSISGIY